MDQPRSRPGPGADALGEILGTVAGARWSVMHVRFDDEVGPHGPQRPTTWQGWRRRTGRFVDEHAALAAAVRAGRVGRADALVARTTVMDAWRRFALADPDLPAHLLPTPWPRRGRARLFLEIHSALGPLAEGRLVEVMAPAWPDARVLGDPLRRGRRPRCTAAGGRAARGER